MSDHGESPLGSSGTLGPVVTTEGIHFSLYSQHATRVDLCLFDSPDREKESRTVPLTRQADHVWRGFVAGAKPGCVYGFRVYGLYAPEDGHRFNPAKLLIDPYARGLARPPKWNIRWHSVNPDLKQEPDSGPDTRDDADCAPLCRVIENTFDWQGDRPPRIPWEDTVIYETHVQGLTALHPQIPEPLRGTFKGLASKPMLDHWKQLGITTVELLPIHQSLDEYHLLQNGLTNYWGYNTLLFFAPDVRFGTGNGEQVVQDFQEMVRALHAAGIEVILDVVFNHSAEGDFRGPTVSFRGIDNANYYRLQDNPAHYENITGCGNALNFHHPRVQQLALDSLRFWVNEMHVDGFRFDLTVTLGRGAQDFDPKHPFFESIRNDPDISQVKLIAEPWDLGPHGYQLGAFPQGWSEWNDQYRQDVRRFWKGDPGQTGLLAQRLSGSSDLFEPHDRPPGSSINYVACHDGFPLADVVSYAKKHNQANKEKNRDGTHHNDSANYGKEGLTDDPHILALRARQARNLMATLLLSRGTPMIGGGDEILRTQQGNNNAYCQANEISWYDWSADPARTRFLEFTRRAIALRKAHPVLRRNLFLKGTPAENSQLSDVTWWKGDGTEMQQEDWDSPSASSLGCLLHEPGGASGSARSDMVLILMNAGTKDMEFILPETGEGGTWSVALMTGEEMTPPSWKPALPFPLQNRSLAVFEWRYATQ